MEQSHRDVEVIAVDDCSADATGAIVAGQADGAVDGDGGGGTGWGGARAPSAHGSCS
ncbi:hypothetical protein AB0B79_37785 [Streptomyces sp. NPDC039022]|uniref:hypothetical protein n=1 Tax=Streptomyces sp. NPDC039022 TaxID=3157091 RepID=UPI00340519BD